MKRIDSAGSINGRWADKNPATGAPGTTLQADWLNSVQEEIASVIENEAGGGTPLDPASQRQLLDAIRKISDKRKKPPTLSGLETTGKDYGGMLFPETFASETSFIHQSDSSMTRVCGTWDLEENFQSRSPPSRNWVWLFEDMSFLPPPIENTALMSSIEWEVGATDILLADVFGMGTAYFLKRKLDQAEPVPRQTSSLGQAFFAKISGGTYKGKSYKNSFCILLRQLEKGSEMEPDLISWQYSYFSQ